jgi:GNAT superfamily N-acetyltransferase
MSSRFAAWSEIGARVSELRVASWAALAAPDRPGRGLTRLEEPLDADSRSRHCIHELGERIVGAARLTLDFLPPSLLAHVTLPDPRGHALFSRLVVAPSFRRRGIAAELDRARIELAARAGQRTLWAEAAEWRVPEMLRLGFRPVARYREQDAVFVNLEVTIVRKDL